MSDTSQPKTALEAIVFLSFLSDRNQNVASDRHQIQKLSEKTKEITERIFKLYGGTNLDEVIASSRTKGAGGLRGWITAVESDFQRQPENESLFAFPNSLAATRFAIDTLHALTDYNKRVHISDEIQVRIGIHFAEVEYQPDGKIIGEALAVASRIAALCEPGSMCISERVYDDVRDQLPDYPMFPLVRAEQDSLRDKVYTITVTRAVPQGTLFQETGSDEANNSADVVSTGIQSLDGVLGGGYPRGSSILVTGPSGIGKEALSYWFARGGLLQGDYCFYVTHRAVSDVLKNMKAFLGVVPSNQPEWMAASGSQIRCDLNDPTSISFNIKKVLQENSDKALRIVTDILSPLFLLNPPDAMYRYFSQILAELKQHNAVFLATVDEGMHPPNVVASMEQLFDGVIEMKVYEQGLTLTPVLRVKKMLGQQPVQDYFRFQFTPKTMEIMPNVAR